MVANERDGQMTKLLLRVKETAEVLSLGRTKAYELIAKGIIPSVRIDGAVRVPAAALEEYVRGLVPGTTTSLQDPPSATRDP